MSEKNRTLKTLGLLGTIGGPVGFLLIRDEMAALLLWIGLGMLAHSYSRQKEQPLWDVFITARRPFVLSFVLALIGAPLFWLAHSVQRLFVRNLFEPLGALLVTLSIAAFLAAIIAWQSRPDTSSS